jgi:hypothetical protein
VDKKGQAAGRKQHIQLAEAEAEDGTVSSRRHSQRHSWVEESRAADVTEAFAYTIGWEGKRAAECAAEETRTSDTEQPLRGVAVAMPISGRSLQEAAEEQDLDDGKGCCVQHLGVPDIRFDAHDVHRRDLVPDDVPALHRSHGRPASHRWSLEDSHGCRQSQKGGIQTNAVAEEAAEEGVGKRIPERSSWERASPCLDGLTLTLKKNDHLQRVLQQS